MVTEDKNVPFFISKSYPNIHWFLNCVNFYVSHNLGHWGTGFSPHTNKHGADSRHVQTTNKADWFVQFFIFLLSSTIWPALQAGGHISWLSLAKCWPEKIVIWPALQAGGHISWLSLAKCLLKKIVIWLHTKQVVNYKGWSGLNAIFRMFQKFKDSDSHNILW